MEKQIWWVLLLCIGSSYSNPYYFRESKHHSEHHKEYSYDGEDGTSHINHKSSQGEFEPSFSSETVAPMKYYSGYVPAQTSSRVVQSQTEGFSLGHGSSQMSSAYQSSIPVSSVSGQHVSYSSSPGGVVVRKVVKVYGYPASTGQSGYYHFSSTSGGSGGSGGAQYLPTRFEGQREESLIPVPQQEESLYGHHRVSKVEIGQAHRDTSDAGQKEESFSHSGYYGKADFGQKAESLEDGSFEIGQEETRDSSFDLGQKVEPVVSHYSHSHYVEKGKKEERLYQKPQAAQDLELVQREESFYPQGGNLEIGQKEESLYPQGGNLEIGQKEESLYPIVSSASLTAGQKEEPIFSQREEKLSHYTISHSIGTGQNGKSLYQKPKQTSGLVVGQKEETLYPQGQNLEIGQKEESLYPIVPSASLTVGQKEEPIFSQREEKVSHYTISHSIGTGQNGKSLYQKPKQTSGFVVGQKEETLYPQGQNLEIGQKEEPIFGQQEESLYNKPDQTSELVVGRKQESLKPLRGHLEISQKEVSGNPNLHSGSLTEGQKEEPIFGQTEEKLHHYSHSHIIETGQEEESMYQKPDKTSGLELGQREESFPSGELDLGQKEESIFDHREKEISRFTHSQSIETGHKDKNLYIKPTGGLEIGQREESLRPQAGNLEIGQREESLHHNLQNGDIELGQKEEPIFEQGKNKFSHYSHSKNIEIGQEEETLYQKPEKPARLELGTTESHTFSGKGLGVGHIEQPIPKYQSSAFQIHKTKEPEELIQKPYQRKLELNQREESLKLQKPDVYVKEVHTKHEHHASSYQGQPVHGSSFQGSRFVQDIGQKEDDIWGKLENPTDNGQREEPLDNPRNLHIPVVKPVSTIRKVSETNHTVIKVHKSTVGQNNDGVVPALIPSASLNKQTFKNEQLGKKVEDLALELAMDGLGKKATSYEFSQTSISNGPKISSSFSTTSTAHNAKIQELGSENFHVKTTPQIEIPDASPVGKVSVYEIHREVGHGYPSNQKSYSKKHSRQHSVISGSHSGGQHYPEELEKLQSQLKSQLESELQSKLESHLQSKLQEGRQSAGGSYSYSYSRSGGYSSGGGDLHYVNDQPVQRQEISQSQSQSDRHAVIDGFLSELDKEIASDNRRGGQSSFTPVSSQQQPSRSGSSYYSESSMTTNGTQSSGSSTSGDRPWYHRISDGINKAKDKIGQTYSQAKDKAKEIVHSVKESVGYS